MLASTKSAKVIFISTALFCTGIIISEEIFYLSDLIAKIKSGNAKLIAWLVKESENCKAAVVVTSNFKSNSWGLLFSV